MPYITVDLVHCCSFVLRSTLHLNREAATDSVADVLQLYKANLGKFFVKRDSPLPIALFMHAFGCPWPEAGQFFEPLVEYAFSATILKNRKYLAISLLKTLMRNAAALGSLDRPTLISQVETLLNNSQRVRETEKINVSLLFFLCSYSIQAEIFVFFFFLLQERKD
jgi:hypothetical protein